MPHRIFVVEDDTRLSGLLTRRLREAGFLADGAADGLGLWTMIRSAPGAFDIDLEQEHAV
jgi:DNA-binding response OmpR family regulator